MNVIVQVLACVLRVLLEDTTRGHTRELGQCRTSGFAWSVLNMSRGGHWVVHSEITTEKATAAPSQMMAFRFFLFCRCEKVVLWNTTSIFECLHTRTHIHTLSQSVQQSGLPSLFLLHSLTTVICYHPNTAPAVHVCIECCVALISKDAQNDAGYTR